MTKQKRPRQLVHPPEGAPIASVRRKVVDAIKDASLRAVAREIGVSPTGLQNFTEGSVPYQPTRRKLVEWYARRTAEDREGSLSAEAGAAALDVLVQELPRDRRASVRREVARTLCRAYEQSRMKPPVWLAEGMDAPQAGDASPGPRG